jgi:hypothetical protein
MLDIQYASDLHIEDWPQGTSFYRFLTPIAPILVVAGDICSAWDPLYKQFLSWASHNWYIVIVVAGNHEYHCHKESHTIFETDMYIYGICQNLTNVKFLQAGATYCIPGTNVRFVGATLWSNVNPDIYEHVSAKKSDYKKCWIGPFKMLHPTDTTMFHMWHCYNLEQSIWPHSDKEILIVVTHYIPTLELLEYEYKNDLIKSCYASNDEWLFQPNITAWICGHGHRATMWRSSTGVPVYMNARGYNRENELKRQKDKYNPMAVLKVTLAQSVPHPHALSVPRT